MGVAPTPDKERSKRQVSAHLEESCDEPPCPLPISEFIREDSPFCRTRPSPDYDRSMPDRSMTVRSTRNTHPGLSLEN
jgi:hypothetical protein